MMDPAQDYPRIFNFALRMLGDRPTAEDVTQEVFLRAQERSGQFRGDAAPSTWLFSIASNLCLDQLRRRSSFSRLVERLGWLGRDRSAPSTEEGVVNRAVGQQILARLKPKSRQLLLLRSSLDLSYQEIAQVLGISPSNVGVLLYRARQEALAVAEKEGIEL